MAREQWVQTDPTLNRDDVIQWFHNLTTNNRVYGKTNGFASSNIHLFYQNGEDSGLNLDPVSGEVSHDGNILGDLLAISMVLVAGAAGGALGASGIAVDSAKELFGPGGKIDLTQLIFPPLLHS